MLQYAAKQLKQEIHNKVADKIVNSMIEDFHKPEDLKKVAQDSIAKMQKYRAELEKSHRGNVSTGSSSTTPMPCT